MIAGLTGEGLLKRLEGGEGLVFGLIKFLLIGVGVFFLFQFGGIELTWQQQLFFGVLVFLIAIWLDKSSNSYLVTLTMMYMSMFATFRYGYWRISTVMDFFMSPASKWTPLDAFFIWILVGAEAYAFIILYLGYVQTIWPLRRVPVPLPDEPMEWPEVDLIIPTYNEPLEVVKHTALASMNIDWPADKLHVYILDDGKREEFRLFAEDAGIGYMTRSDNKHAKAGNINRALAKLHSPYVCIFDCDHVPTRSFLQVTMGWFFRDKNLAMLQTPHHFYSPDPFERNLSQFKAIPNEGELFYGIVQDGNDFWNATFFCGSCAVLRRTALDQIGGIAVETVTEDAHTSLKMQINGWNTAYINIPQAAGLATERLSGHVKQRIRWARGMVQILRTDNPLLVPGLSWAQRLCYFNAMAHFMYALPRLIFLTAPLIYLVLGHVNVPGSWEAILAYALPHLVLSSMTNSRIQGEHRHSFWNEVYETVLAPYILSPTIMAMINPKLGEFNVTAKGGFVDESFFDARIAQPFVLLLGLNLFGLLMFFPRFFHMDIPLIGDLYDGTHPGTIVMNCFWTFFNIVILGVTLAVAWEAQQRRAQVRVEMKIPVRVLLPDGSELPGITADMSSGGAAIRLEEMLEIPKGTGVKLVFPTRSGDGELPATLLSTVGQELRIQFDPLTLNEQERLTMVLYSSADTWIGWGESRAVDSPLRSLAGIFKLSMYGLWHTGKSLILPEKKTARKKTTVPAKATIAALLLLCSGGFLVPHAGAMAGRASQSSTGANPGMKKRPGKLAAAAASDVTNAAAVPAATMATAGAFGTAAGTFKHDFALSEVGVTESIEMRGVDAYNAVTFSIPQNEVIRQASMHVRAHFSPGLIPAMSHIKVMLNGTMFATLQMPEQRQGSADTVVEQTLMMPAELLVRQNQLVFEFIGHYTTQCEDPANTILWSRIDNTSQLSFAGNLLPLADDLKLLPLPFYDAALTQPPSVPIVFMNTPNAESMEAAGIVASWFGVLADYRSVRFPVSIGTIPAGNAILISDNPSSLPSSLGLTSASGAGITGPSVSMRANPNDPYSKVLIVSGDDGAQLVKAAQAMAMQSSVLQGGTQQVSSVVLPTAREADDAPRWMRTDKITPLWEYATNPEQLQVLGSGTMNIYMRIPPDLYFAEKTNLGLHIDYRYNPIPLGDASTMNVLMNAAFENVVPLPHKESATATPTIILPVPVVNLRPFSNTLTARFLFQINKKGQCQDTVPLNLQGSILRTSYLDILGLPHYAAMPNLELFSNGGFPFTRFADLSQTTVVMPDAPTAQEVELFLTLMGHFGAQTGFPALRVTVAGADALADGKDRDFLVLGTTQDQAGIGKLAKALPVSIDADGVHVHDAEGFFAPLRHAWWKLRSNERPTSGELVTAGGLPEAILEGIESPYSSDRSVVLVAVKDQASIEPFITAFLKSITNSDIKSSVSVMHGTGFESYQIGTNVYRVGHLPWWRAISIWFAQYPWMVAVVMVVICFFLAVWTRVGLRRRARLRLQTQPELVGSAH